MGAAPHLAPPVAGTASRGRLPCTVGAASWPLAEGGAWRCTTHRHEGFDLLPHSVHLQTCAARRGTGQLAGVCAGWPHPLRLRATLLRPQSAPLPVGTAPRLLPGPALVFE